MVVSRLAFGRVCNHKAKTKDKKTNGNGRDGQRRSTKLTINCEVCSCYYPSKVRILKQN